MSITTILLGDNHFEHILSIDWTETKYPCAVETETYLDPICYYVSVALTIYDKIQNAYL